MSDLTPEAWDNRYQTQTDRWNLGCPAPPFVQLLDESHAPKPGRIAVLGCGSGQDAMLFAMAGFDVIGFDFAPSAIDRATVTARSRELQNIQFLQRNIFELEPEFNNHFDYVLEHTCFCAIDPVLRLDYVQIVKQLLKPNGTLIGLFYTHNRSGGPPFGVKPKEVLEYFKPDFKTIAFGKAEDSIDKRKGEEHLGIFQVRSV